MPGRTATKSVIDHCVEVIRHALMCHADTAVVTYSWRPDTRRPWPDFSVDQTCVDWDALDSWAAERSFSAFDQKSLVHPELGGFESVLRCYLTDQLRLNTNFRDRVSNRK